MKKLILVSILLVTVVLNTSCWSRREIEDLGFVLGLGLSRNEETGLYVVVAQVANPSAIVAETPEHRDVYTIVKSEGLTIFDALRNLSLNTGRRLYLAHIKTVIIDESIAKEGFTEVMGFIVQDLEVRLESKVFISKVPPEEIFDTPNILGAIPALVLDTAAKNYGATSKIYVSDLHRTVDVANNPILNYVTTLVEIIPKPSEKDLPQMKLTQLAVFEHDRLRGYLDYEEGQGYNFITNNFKNGLIVFNHPVEDSVFTIEILESNTKITPRYINNQVSFDIELKVKGNVAERLPHGHIILILDIPLLQNQLDQVLEDKLRQSFNTAQKEFQVDFFNLSGDFFRKYPQEFKEIKDDWDKVFSKADINIKVESTIIHSALSSNRGRS